MTPSTPAMPPQPCQGPGFGPEAQKHPLAADLLLSPKAASLYGPLVWSSPSLPQHSLAEQGPAQTPQCTDRAPHGAEQAAVRQHLGSGCCLSTASPTASRSPQAPSRHLQHPAESNSTKKQGSCQHKVLLTPPAARSLPLCPPKGPSSTCSTNLGMPRLPQPTTTRRNSPV